MHAMAAASIREQCSKPQLMLQFIEPPNISVISYHIQSYIHVVLDLTTNSCTLLQSLVLNLPFLKLFIFSAMTANQCFLFRQLNVSTHKTQIIVVAFFLLGPLVLSLSIP